MKSSPFTAVSDACVLYPAPLRDFLMWLALSGRFRARWTRLIHDEWQRNLLKNRPDLQPDQLQRTIELMNSAIPDALTVFGIEAQHPDDFIDNLFDLDPAAVVTAAREQRGTLKNPALSVDRYLEILLKQGLSRTARNLVGFRSVL
ncbi:PIN domain-containing protein [Variovorax sp. RHLX14]|uniref:PIN domain-containing protein n=1 Tax=Variovorax sp. RHLX14 TaxID=1259731 RepID=UPI003F469047